MAHTPNPQHIQSAHPESTHLPKLAPCQVIARGWVNSGPLTVSMSQTLKQHINLYYGNKNCPGGGVSLTFCELPKILFWNLFKLKLCTCAQSHLLDTHAEFQREIITINVISGIVYVRKIIWESSRNISETTCWSLEIFRTFIIFITKTWNLSKNSAVENAKSWFARQTTSWVQPPILTISSNLAIVTKLGDPKCL